MDRGVVWGNAIGGGGAVAPKVMIADEGRARHLADAGTPRRRRRRLRLLLLRRRRRLLLLLGMKDVVVDARREVAMRGRVAERPRPSTHRAVDPRRRRNAARLTRVRGGSMRAIEDELLRPDGPVGVPTCRGMGGATEIGLSDTLCAVVKCGTSVTRGLGAM
jgi:hypothetical protein